MVCVLAAAAGSAFGQTGNAYVTTNLVSNVTGGAPVVDPNLVDPWGISISASSPFWVSDHLSGQSTLYNGSGVVSATVVTIPPGAASAAGALGRPTGQVQNNLSTASPIPFLLPAPNGKTASFIFCTDDGTLSAWNGSVTAGTAVIVVDNSAARAVYKGMAIATSAQGRLSADYDRQSDCDLRPVGPDLRQQQERRRYQHALFRGRTAQRRHGRARPDRKHCAACGHHQNHERRQ